MTGGQDHPASGKTLCGEDAPKLDLAALAKAVGVEDVLVVDPYDLDALEKALRYAVRTGKPSVVIAQRACVLTDRTSRRTPPVVDAENCNGCGLCLRIGCPAIESLGEGDKSKALINADLCTGCDVCIQVCRLGAITREQE